MNRRVFAFVELLIAVLVSVAAVWCWTKGVTTTQLAATPGGDPAFASTYYSGVWLTGAFVTAGVGAVLFVDGARRLWAPADTETGDT